MKLIFYLKKVYNIQSKILFMVSTHTTVSISNKILKKIDEVIVSGKTTYSTRSDFIKDALRIRLRDLGFEI